MLKEVKLRGIGCAVGILLKGNRLQEYLAFPCKPQVLHVAGWRRAPQVLGLPIVIRKLGIPRTSTKEKELPLFFAVNVRSYPPFPCEIRLKLGWEVPEEPS
jgi:hypothetical protein